MSIIKKLQAPKGSLLGGLEEDLMEEIGINTILSMMPTNITETIKEAKPIIEKLLVSIGEKLGDDKSIAIIRKVNNDIVLMLLKAKETDIDLKDEKTIIETINLSAICKQFFDI